MMRSDAIRTDFLSYFAERDHRVVPSSPLVLPDDPTLLFANAGMNQFKSLFTGSERRDYRRAASSQKCLRVSGKHNDLETVGRTPRHHTFFEMLGNFSFGDYFKQPAVEYAWELLTERWGLPVERLWVSVFGGTADLAADSEALEIWRDRIGVREDRILRLGEQDNFWRMGDTGPCGPCSEIYFDLGDDLTSTSGASTPETDERRFIEVWNLVFMQFEQRSAEERIALPAPSIDTGMGLERIASILQDKRSNYETDLFLPALTAAARRAGTRYGADAEADFSLRVLADHSRAFCFLVADGVVPANDNRGYVLRRLLRRAMRHGRRLGIGEPFLHEITPVVIDGLSAAYPELDRARDAIREIGLREERRFAATLSSGLQLLEEAFARSATAAPAAPVLSGSDLFRLYDTFGFPLDLARDIAAERGVGLDEAGFRAEMEQQRARAQASWKRAEAAQVPAELRRLAGEHPTEFAGYGNPSLDGVPIVALLQDGRPVERLAEGAEGEAVLAATPFYAEAGGQVGDTGTLSGPRGRATVLDTRRPCEGLVAHRIRVTSGTLGAAESVLAEIDDGRRWSIRRNHTATHLLHAALRDVVGGHVKQAGSLVAPDRLRFDFFHFAGLDDEALADVESLVNRKVLEDLPVLIEQLDLDEALRRGAMALFGEKYGDRVRVVGIGDFSLELCGGTHTERSGEIGLVKLTQERGIASGVRRIEAISGEGALDRFRRASDVLRRLEEQLAVPEEQLPEEVGRRIEQARSWHKELEQQRVRTLQERLTGRIATAPAVGGSRVLAERVDGLRPQEMRELADALRGKLHSGVVVLGRAEGGKASLLVAVTGDLRARVPAGELVRELGRLIGGGGGGRPDMAEAGGRSPERLDEALGEARSAVARRLEGETTET